MTKSTAHFTLVMLGLSAFLAASATFAIVLPSLLRPTPADCSCVAAVGAPRWVWPVAALALAFFIRFVVAVGRTWWQTARFIRQATARRTPLTESSVTTPVDLIPDSDAIFCYGFLRPRIAVGERVLGILSAAQRRSILSHEEAHAQRHDPLRLFLVSVVAAFLGSRLGQKLLRAYTVDLECDADQTAVRQYGRTALAHAFVQLLDLPAHAAPLPALSVTESRIRRLLGERDPGPRLRPLIMIVLAVTIFSFFGIRATVRAVQISPPPVAAGGMCLRPPVCNVAAPVRYQCFRTEGMTICLPPAVVESFTRRP